MLAAFFSIRRRFLGTGAWILIITAVHLPLAAQPDPEPPVYGADEIFPLQSQHVHGSTLVELPGGTFLAAWFQGSGERWADDVAIMGARRAVDGSWSEPFLMADVPEFPDINPVLFIDGRDRLWLTWYTVLANQWETSLLKYRISEDYAGDGPPVWAWQDVIHVKPGDRTERGMQPNDRFVVSMEQQLEDYLEYLSTNDTFEQGEGTVEENKARWQAHFDNLMALARGDNMVRAGRLQNPDGTVTEQPLGYPYFRRMGWQTRNKPELLDDGRIILPLYSDGFSISLMAVTDDGGSTWAFSNPLAGAGNIQPAIAQKADGTLVAYMRDNGPPPKSLHISTSSDRGLTWTNVRDTDLPNPGSGADVVTLENGHWALVYNDTEAGRHSLAVSISADEGETWPWTRHLELDDPGEGGEDATRRGHYPAIVQGSDGLLHVTYSFNLNQPDGQLKTIKYARFNEPWVRAGDPTD